MQNYKEYFIPYSLSSQVSSCVTCGRQRGTGVVSLRVLLLALPILIRAYAPLLSSIIWGWHSGPFKVYVALNSVSAHPQNENKVKALFIQLFRQDSLPFLKRKALTDLGEWKDSFVQNRLGGTCDPQAASWTALSCSFDLSCVMVSPHIAELFTGECTRPHIAITPLACHSNERR
jgi:hypothetical protein